jgi:hypothetical protein
MTQALYAHMNNKQFKKKWLLLILQYWSLISGPCTCWVGILQLEPHLPAMAFKSQLVVEESYFSGLKPAQANSFRDPISKEPFTKKGLWSGSRYRP